MKGRGDNRYDSSVAYASKSMTVKYCTRCRLQFVGVHVCDLGPLRFERINEWEQPNATYRLYCPTCHLSVTVQTPLDMVRRYRDCGNDADAPHDPDARAIWLIADVFSGDREKRTENKKIDEHEARLREQATFDLGRSCPHARGA